MLDFTFLTKEQLFDDDKLEIIKKIGVKAAITDFAILLGGTVDDMYDYIDSDPLEDKRGCYWTRSSNGNNEVYVVVVIETLLEFSMVFAQLYLTLQSNQSP